MDLPKVEVENNITVVRWKDEFRLAGHMIKLMSDVLVYVGKICKSSKKEFSTLNFFLWTLGISKASLQCCFFIESLSNQSIVRDIVCDCGGLDCREWPHAMVDHVMVNTCTQFFLLISPGICLHYYQIINSLSTTVVFEFVSPATWLQK